MSSATDSKPCKFATYHRDPSNFQSSAVHKYVDAAGPIENRCDCTFCRDYQREYRAERSTYQDLHPFGLEEFPPSSEETAFSVIEGDTTSTSPSTEETAVRVNDEAITTPPGEETVFHTTEENTNSRSGEELIIILILITRDHPLPSVDFDFIDTVRRVKMAPASNEEQFKFLISCIRHSNNGKVDFTEVAKECNIVSKGAAAKRYERMMKANGIHQSQGGGTTASGIRDTATPSPRRKTSPSAGPINSKKRKLEKYAGTTVDVNTDDDEGFSNFKDELNSAVKDEVIKAEPIKQEPTNLEGTLDSEASTGAFQHPFNGAMGFDGSDDSALMDDFLAFGGSSEPDYGTAAVIEGGFSEEGFAPANTTPATGSGDGQGLHESIIITD